MDLMELDEITHTLYGRGQACRGINKALALTCKCPTSRVRGWKDRGHVPNGYSELLRLHVRITETMGWSASI